MKKFERKKLNFFKFIFIYKMIYLNKISNLRILISNKLISYTIKQIKAQSTLKTYKIESKLFKQILTEELSILSNVFKKNNFELRIAGGAVRDLIMNILPHDIDLATNALPDQMIKIFNKENIRIINLNGLKHGTVPVRINDKVNNLINEIITLKIAFFSKILKLQPLELT